MKKYFEGIDKATRRAYEIAQEARKKGYDPQKDVEVKIARNMAERVVGLISTVTNALDDEAIVKRIGELESTYGVLDWRVALIIGKEVAEGKFGKVNTKKEMIELGIRTGFAYHTVGIVAAPLEGFTEVEIKKRRDGKEYLSVKFSGPVRGAGGTAASFCVILSDYIRITLGLDAYDPDEQEVNRYVREVNDYHERVTPLQYHPSDDELAYLIKHVPVEIGGDPTEKLEVSNYKDLERIETNRIRGGMALVVSMIALKAPKLWKRLGVWGKEFQLDWLWLDDFISLQKRIKAHSSSKVSKKEEVSKISPNYSFISELVAGRPVFSYPLANGGFRLRYGRARTTGFSSAGVHPATMAICDDFIAVGTQLKMERPGKAAGISACDSIMGPIVLLDDGSVRKLDSYKEAKAVNKRVKEILYLGDILFNYGDFSENGHSLVPAGYCAEWWVAELERAVKVAILKERRKDKGRKKESAGDGEAVTTAADAKDAVRAGDEIDAKDTINAISAKNGKAAADVLEIEKIDEKEIVSYLKKRFQLENPFIFDDPPKYEVDFLTAKMLSRELSIPLHPKYIFFWKEISADDVCELINHLSMHSSLKRDATKVKLVVFVSEKNEEHSRIKRIFELLGVEHSFVNHEYVVINEEEALPFLFNLGLDKENIPSSCNSALAKVMGNEKLKNGLDVVNQLCEVEIRDLSGTFIGARMGRPEKAKARALKGSPNVLFPVGNEGGRLRSFNEALTKGKITAESPRYHCEKCDFDTVHPICDKCNMPAKQMFYCPGCNEWMYDKECKKHGENKWFGRQEIDIKDIFHSNIKRIGIGQPQMIKGVRGTSNKYHIPEHFAKGIIRAKHGVTVNKDGTVRYDISELPITHFKPKEIRTSVKKLKSLGYSEDINGNPLVDEDQILELRPQDIILPSVKEGFEEGADKVLVRVARFIDDLLEKFYGMKPFYNLKDSDDLIGQFVVGLAPHISCGMVGRIIGFSDTQALFASPMFHAALRRDCDGDEACVLLMMDAFLNFSRQYLPDRRGSRTMDAPLVLTPIIDPAEVDDMVLGLDVAKRYPLELYEAAQKYKKTGEVIIDSIGKRLGKESQYEGFGFTHQTSDINDAVLISSYKTLPTMQDKMKKQMELGVKIRAVKQDDVARLVIEKHFMKDLKGNLRKFSQQNFRCVNCNEIYRRPPLSGICNKCGGRIIYTISQGSVVKYLQPSLNLMRDYELSPYLEQSLELLTNRIETLFGKETEKQDNLSKWF